jgi:hypothetical protein
MDLTFICPVSYLERLDQYQDNYLLLAHIAKESKEYRDFFRQNPKYKILDNSAHELGDAFDFEEVLDLAREMNCQEVVLPDKIFHCDETLTRTLQTLDKLRAKGVEGEFKWMAVPQGQTWDEYQKCFTAFTKHPKVDVIGAGFWIIAKCYSQFSLEDEVMPNRLMFSRELSTRFDQPAFYARPQKPIHLLGLGDCYELKGQKHYPFIRSNDSSAAVRYGMHGQAFTVEKGRGPRIRSDLDFFAPFDEKTFDTVVNNIKVIQELASFE